LPLEAYGENEIGMFYLKFERNPHKARNAWKDALDITPGFGTRFPAIQSFIGAYDAALEKKGEAFVSRVISVDLETDEFAVSLHSFDGAGLGRR